MILFLDTVSSLPEFSLIKENKIIYSKKILSNPDEKMSDLLIPSYLEIKKKFNLNSELHLLIVNTGPGSYTALRVGIAFFSGLSISKNINLVGISCADLFRYFILDKELNSSGIYIVSSNQQNFFGYFDSKIQHFEIKKIENNISLEKQNIDLSRIKTIFTNISFQENELFEDKMLKKISFSEIVNINIEKIKNLKSNDIIDPVYYSNNQILN